MDEPVIHPFYGRVVLHGNTDARRRALIAVAVDALVPLGVDRVTCILRFLMDSNFFDEYIPTLPAWLPQMATFDDDEELSMPHIPTFA